MNMAETVYKCNQCGAIVNFSDILCPNGHDLKEVGKNMAYDVGNTEF